MGDSETPVTPSPPSPPPSEGVKETVSNALRVFQKVEEEGTPLRSVIGNARQELSKTVNGIKGKLDDTQAWVNDSLGSLGGVIKREDVQAVSDFSKKHPEVLVGAVVLLVGVPTAFVSKRKAVVSSLVAGGGTYALFGLSNFWQRRRGTPPGKPSP